MLSLRATSLVVLFCTMGLAVFAQEDRPNILFLFTDDQTYEALHALGNTEIHTPNIDKLVNGGTTFTHAYNMGGWNGAICVASRSMMISGRSIWRANDFKDNWTNGEELDKTWGKLMEQVGYRTYMTGKWHVAAPAEQVFQHANHIRPGMPPDAWGGSNMGQKFRDLEAGKYQSIEEIMPVGYNRPLNNQDDLWSPSDTSFGGFWKGGKHWSEVVADDAISYIDDAKHYDAPFFMYIAFNAPHDPRQSPPEFVEMYPLDGIPLPQSFLPEHPLKDKMGCGPGLRDEALAPFPRTEYAVKTHIQEYYAIITHLDRQIGRILESLKASGKEDDTYIFFTADHGLAVGQHGLLGKQNMYDHSIRVPLMVCGPNIPMAKKIDTDIYLQDLMATALDLAHVAKPEYIEFNSLLPLIDGSQTKSSYEAIYGAYVDWQRMIRKDQFKLIVYPNAGQMELFDMQSDPEEMHDLGNLPAFQEKKNQLLADLIKLQQHFEDPLQLQ